MRVFTIMGNTLKCLQLNSFTIINNELNIRNHHYPTISEINKFPDLNHIHNQVEHTQTHGKNFIYC